jgi:hypothetical protein
MKEITKGESAKDNTVKRRRIEAKCEGNTT